MISHGPLGSFCLKQLETEVLALRQVPSDRLEVMRNKLIALVAKTPNKKHGAVTPFLFTIKEILAFRAGKTSMSSMQRKHEISDHAFVRALDRFYGVDVDGLKDKVLVDLQAGKFHARRAVDGTVVTIIPNKEIA